MIHFRECWGSAKHLAFLPGYRFQRRARLSGGITGTENANRGGNGIASCPQMGRKESFLRGRRRVVSMRSAELMSANLAAGLLGDVADKAACALCQLGLFICGGRGSPPQANPLTTGRSRRLSVAVSAPNSVRLANWRWQRGIRFVLGLVVPARGTARFGGLGLWRGRRRVADRPTLLTAFAHRHVDNPVRELGDRRSLVLIPLRLDAGANRQFLSRR